MGPCREAWNTCARVAWQVFLPEIDATVVKTNGIREDCHVHCGRAGLLTHGHVAEAKSSELESRETRKSWALRGMLGAGERSQVWRLFGDAACRLFLAFFRGGEHFESSCFHNSLAQQHLRVFVFGVFRGFPWHLPQKRRFLRGLRFGRCRTWSSCLAAGTDVGPWVQERHVFPHFGSSKALKSTFGSFRFLSVPFGSFRFLHFFPPGSRRISFLQPPDLVCHFVKVPKRVSRENTESNAADLNNDDEKTNGFRVWADLGLSARSNPMGTRKNKTEHPEMTGCAESCLQVSDVCFPIGE